jgi:hypothetical protein
MKIELFEQDLLKDPFFGFTVAALLQCADAKWSHQPRPLPQIEKPRKHTSMWLECDGHLVMIDMNDHVFFYDTEALKRCDVYFKANLNWQVTDKVLERDHLQEHRGKIKPYFFFATAPERIHQSRWLHPLAMLRRPRHDVCHIVGVYENPPKAGKPSPFLTPGSKIEPSDYHFWIRYHIQEALKVSGLSGYYRLTSRQNSAIEDQKIVFPNVSEYKFVSAILDSQFTMVNTLPHAVLPWKATESMALGRPIVMERTPLIEMPAPFKMKAGSHYLELLPDFGEFSSSADIEDPLSYRVLEPVDLNLLRTRVQILKGQLADKALTGYMNEQVRIYSQTALTRGTVSDYIREQVGKSIH